MSNSPPANHHHDKVQVVFKEMGQTVETIIRNDKCLSEKFRQALALIINHSFD
ncbi:MAG: hypothetical protein Q4A84_03610 [Neisseria sp.]|uniref:hypothetical protein n=1 Tax=Neisseria sp. TaxID=192066 RepID=UPI0026DAD78A|nr:hypothetical protein [Neisseria sp.]MDO4640776.1 hypothetical protein [Neisseria sp.]